RRGVDMRISLAVFGFGIGLTGIAAFAGTGTGAPTFNKEVLPILQKNCQGCHRPGEVAPMSLINYTDARPWAKAIKASILSKKMPPWFADTRVGLHFSNQMSLSDADLS